MYGWNNEYHIRNKKGKSMSLNLTFCTKFQFLCVCCWIYANSLNFRIKCHTNCIVSHLIYFFASKLLLWCVLHCIHLEAKIHLNFFHFVYLHLFLSSIVCLFYWLKCDGYLNTMYQLKNKCSSYVACSIVLHRNHFKSIQWWGSLAIYWSNQLNVQ